MGFLDKISEVISEEKEKAINNSKSTNGRSRGESIYENFLKTLENATGKSRDNFNIKDKK